MSVCCSFTDSALTQRSKTSTVCADVAMVREKPLLRQSNCREAPGERRVWQSVGLRCSIAKHRIDLNPARASADFDDFMHVKEVAHIGNM
jgi:hypothetical protein